MKKLALALIIFSFSGYVYAEANPTIHQEQLKDTSTDFQEDATANYASIVLASGLDFLQNVPNKLKTDIPIFRWPDISVHYNMPINLSHFMFSPGVIWGSHSYKFKDNYTLTRIEGGQPNRHTTITEAKSLLGPKAELRSSNLDISYISLVGELRFNTNRLEPQDGFFIAVGGNLGILLHAATTISYKEDNQIKTLCMKESFNLNQLRYGVVCRIGWRRFGAFYAQTLSNLFNKQGLYKHAIKPFSIGLTIDLL